MNLYHLELTPESYNYVVEVLNAKGDRSFLIDLTEKSRGVSHRV